MISSPIADGYVADVLSGAIVAGRWTKLACQRFQRMRSLVTYTSDGSGHTENGMGAHTVSYTWSPSHVQDVCTFIERLPHVEGRWTSPTITLAPWQIFVLAACYGFRRASDGEWLVTTVFFEVARKSAKSTLVAAAALYHLAVEDEPGAQVIAAASTGNQARIVFGIMARMVKRAPWLRALGFVAYANAIVFKDGSTAKPINAKSSTQDGLNPSFISLDESHAQDFELFDVLKSAQGARADAALWAPTTAGYSLTSVGYALRSTAMKILDGVLESDHTFVVLYELDETDDWADETTWIKAAPMIGTTPTLEYVRRYRDDAIATPGLKGSFPSRSATAGCTRRQPGCRCQKRGTRAPIPSMHSRYSNTNRASSASTWPRATISPRWRWCSCVKASCMSSCAGISRRWSSTSDRARCRSISSG